MHLIFHCQGYRFTIDLRESTHRIEKGGEVIREGGSVINLPDDVECVDAAGKKVSTPAIDQFGFASVNDEEASFMTALRPEDRVREAMKREWYLYQITLHPQISHALLITMPHEGKVEVIDQRRPLAQA